jgi:TPR repeat protein
MKLGYLNVALLITLMSWQGSSLAQVNGSNKQQSIESQMAEHRQVTSLLGDEYRVKSFLSANQIQALMDKTTNGDSNAALKLAFYYQKPAFSKPNVEQSLFWFDKAAKMNHPEAMFQLGSIYNTGEHVTKNLNTALQYYVHAVVADHPHSYLAIAKMLSVAKERGDMIKQLTQLFIDEDEANTGEYLFLIARIFTWDKLVAKDVDLAMEIYQVAMKYGAEQASYFYAKRKWLQSGPDYNFAKAWPYIEPLLAKNKFLANKLSWQLCTNKGEQVRNPVQGYKVISRLALAKDNYQHQDTLAACLAGVGQFNKAIKIQQAVVDALTVNHQPLKGYGERLALYNKGEIYIDDESEDEQNGSNEDDCQ